MDANIIVAIITGILTLIGVMISNKTHNNKITTLIYYRLDIIEKKQDKYNDVIRRQYESEKEIELVKERQCVANHRISDLEDIDKKLG